MRALGARRRHARRGAPTAVPSGRRRRMADTARTCPRRPHHPAAGGRLRTARAAPAPGADAGPAGARRPPPAGAAHRRSAWPSRPPLSGRAAARGRPGRWPPCWSARRVLGWDNDLVDETRRPAPTSAPTSRSPPGALDRGHASASRSPARCCWSSRWRSRAASPPACAYLLSLAVGAARQPSCCATGGCSWLPWAVVVRAATRRSSRTAGGAAARTATRPTIAMTVLAALLGVGVHVLHLAARAWSTTTSAGRRHLPLRLALRVGAPRLLVLAGLYCAVRGRRRSLRRRQHGRAVAVAPGRRGRPLGCAPCSAHRRRRRDRRPPTTCEGLARAPATHPRRSAQPALAATLALPPAASTTRPTRSTHRGRASTTATATVDVLERRDRVAKQADRGTFIATFVQQQPDQGDQPSTVRRRATTPRSDGRRFDAVHDRRRAACVNLAERRRHPGDGTFDAGRVRRPSRSRSTTARPSTSSVPVVADDGQCAGLDTARRRPRRVAVGVHAESVGRLVPERLVTS